MRFCTAAIACGLFLCSVFLQTDRADAETVLVPGGEKSNWRYLDDGLQPDAKWTIRGFDDSGWKQGKSPLGYAASSLNTRVSFGDDAKAKHITTYFRTRFDVSKEDRSKIEKLGLSLRRDDGAILFLNGKEVVRSNVPAGDFDGKTTATSAVGKPAAPPQMYLIDASLLAKDSDNIIAAEVHQVAADSSDLFFDLKVVGYKAGEAPPQNFYQEGLTAIRRGDYEQAAEQWNRLEPDHPKYAEALSLLGYRIYAVALGRPKDGLRFVKKAYDAAPGDKFIVRSFIKTNLMAGVLFDDKDLARDRAKQVAEEHRFLISKPDWGDKSRKFKRQQLEQDLDYLEHLLVNCFAYLELKNVDYRGALDAIRRSLDDETPIDTFELQIAKLISLFCDGHANTMRQPLQYLPSGYAPFLAGYHDGRVYLYKVDSSGFLEEDFPYVTAIDGVTIDRWMEVAGYTVVKESPQWHRRRSLTNLGLVNYIRAELSLPASETITLTLQSEDRKQSKEFKVKVRSRFASKRPFPSGRSRRIENVGYLRISQMTRNSFFLGALNAKMKEFRDTDGLIIDVRGNGGGSKDVLFTLFPYFMQPDAPMRVVEFSTYRMPMELPKPNPGGFMMSNMSAQVITSPRWKNDEQRAMVRKAIDELKTEWELPMKKYSQWHVLALGASDNPKAYYYDKPLVILQDAGSFSASDIFLGAFEDHPNTTLIGEPSGGGNGWMDRYKLPNSGIGVVLCQSAKFRPSGRLYDSVGIDPDVKILATPKDIFGKGDSVLEAAVKRLSSETAKRP